MLLFGMSYICLQIFQLIGISHTHFCPITAIDLAMVGALGASALASVGIMGQPEMVMLIFCRALSIAVTAIIARRHGESEVDGMNAVLKQSILLNFLIYVPLLAICFL